MKRIKSNEKGYTMLIVLLAVVLFMVMGVSLMTLNMSNVTKNESRESNTQAQDLAVKGLDYVVKEIEYKVEELAAAAGGLTLQQFETQFKGILDSYKCSIGSSNLQNTQTGSATYCIENYQDTANETPHLKKVTFRSIGEANEREYTTQATYLLGSSVSDEFEYALLTYGNDNFNLNKTDTTGNIELHGALQVKGDVYADNVFISSESSRYKNTIVPTVAPLVESTIINPLTGEPFKDRIYQKAKTGDGTDIKVIQIDKLAVPHDDKTKLENDLQFVDEKEYKATLFEDVANLNTVGYEKKLFNPLKASYLDGNIKVDFDIVNRIAQARAQFYHSGTANFKSDVKPIQTGYIGSEYIWGTRYSNYALLKPMRLLGNGKHEYYEASVRNLNSNDSKVYPRGYRALVEGLDLADVELTNPEKFNWEVYGLNDLKDANVAFPQEMRLQYGSEAGSASTNPTLKVKTAYIGKDMIVGLNNKNETNFGLLNSMLDLDALRLVSGLENLINLDTPVHLEGIYYVNGDLTISSTRLTGNATFFVKGMTTVVFADVGVKRPTIPDESKFNLISHGPVKFAYIGNNHNENEKAKKYKDFIDNVHESKWNGHIHSDQKIVIDGATSNIEFNGSMSAPEILVTSIKGRSIPSCRDIGYYAQNHLIDGALGPLLKGILGLLITNEIADKLVTELFKVLFGDEHAGNGYNIILDKAGTKYSSNCFEKIAGQNSSSVEAPNYLIKALGVQVLGAGTDQHKIKSRVRINYDSAPISELKQSFNITYEGTPKITQLDPPKAVSRD